jgi:glutamate/tyrosine decarboxylase-like PLP-dependent enzyme
MDYSILDKSWTEQKAWIIDLVKSRIPETRVDEKVAILISEVHYLTGLVINVSEIIDALRTENPNLVFMVDGSQSVGNLLKPLNTLANKLHRADFYYFSAHKWLLSPNTCGVFIAEQNASRYQVQPYDLFGTMVPSATIDPGVIFGTRSSLEYLVSDNMDRLRKFHEKASLLKEYFIERIVDEFEVIQSNSMEMNRSLFIAVRPRRGKRWTDETVQEFWTNITQDGVDLTLVPLEGVQPSTWWLRISFPYFLQLHLLKQLIKHLNARVTSIN